MNTGSAVWIIVCNGLKYGI